MIGLSLSSEIEGCDDNNNNTTAEAERSYENLSYAEKVSRREKILSASSHKSDVSLQKKDLVHNGSKDPAKSFVAKGLEAEADSTEGQAKGVGHSTRNVAEAPKIYAHVSAKSERALKTQVRVEGRNGFVLPIFEEGSFKIRICTCIKKNFKYIFNSMYRYPPNIR